MKSLTFLRTFWHAYWNPKVWVVQEPKLTANTRINKYNSPLGEAWTRSYANNPIIGFGFIPTESKLWVYNVSRVDHKFDHPMLGDVTIPANKTRKRHALWTSFPEIVSATNYSIDTDEMYVQPMGGKYFVDDLINPACHEGAGWLGATTTSTGRDLSVRGVFWSYSNPPKPAEVNAAVKKMKEHYTKLLEKQKTLDEVQSRRSSTEASPELLAAREYFKVRP